MSLPNSDDLPGLPPPPRGPRRPPATRNTPGPPAIAPYLVGLAPSRVFSLESADRRRPLISHGQQPSIDSMESTSSMEPASTAENEPRISISSTLYPASSDDDHQPDLYAPQRPESFIDLYQPDDTDDDDRPPGSPIHFAPMAPPQVPRPPTTNLLDTGERADLVRKSRKLTRLFGQTPAAAVMAAHRPAPVLSGAARARAAFSLADAALAPSAGPRRHSMPLSPDDVSFLSIASPPFEAATFPRRPASPTSFIDISDDEAPAPPTPRRLASMASFDTLDPDALAEDERRRKRERLAKLHRFLGSRVPANLVLGIDDPEASLPQPAPVSSESDDSARKIWLKRRRSSSVVVLPSCDLERVREELDDKEKAINVRRAQKMEKVFGVAPPQTLYHTRHCATPPRSSDSDPAATPPATPRAPTSAAAPAAVAPARLAHTKPKGKKHARPGTAESSKQLLPKDPPADIYSHYQHSLNSLHDILDRDDRASLAELHEYLYTPNLDPAPHVPDDDAVFDFAPNAAVDARERRLSVASSTKSERRRSLPARTSRLSLASLAPSEFTIALGPLSPAAVDGAAFQVRRRRAAKLTQFFGVNYRDLITDVLDSIETGVEHEHQRGTLRAEEVEDLLTKLRTLKTKRTGLF